MDNRNISVNTDKDKTNVLIRLAHPSCGDAANWLLVTIARRQLEGRPKKRTALTAFQLWHLEALLMESIVIEDESGYLWVDDDVLETFGEWAT